MNGAHGAVPFFPKFLFQNSFSKVLSMAPAKLMGCGIYYIKALHLAQQIEFIIKHIQAQTTGGKMALSMIRWGQLCVGTQQHI